MPWIKRDMWVPENIDPEKIHQEEPLLIISPYRNWLIIRDEVMAESHDYPIRLKTPFSMVYGMRIRDYQVRHTSSQDKRDILRWIDWMDIVRCRVAPK